jgi:hypothetical protein
MIENIIICILFLLIIYYILKKSPEHFSVPNVDDLYIQTSIDQNYRDKIRDLDIILNFVKNNSKDNNNFVINSNTPIPVKNIISGQMNINGTHKFKNLKINGDLNINGGLEINTNEGKNKIEIIPRYMIVAWCNNFYKRMTILPEDLDNGIIEGVNDKKFEAIILDIPEGWVLCDGKKYIIENGKPIQTVNDPSIQTPDLRDRFVIGATDEFSYKDQEAIFNNVPNDQVETIFISKYEFGKKYGNNKYQLKEQDLLNHWHNFAYESPIYLNEINNINYSLYLNNFGETTIDSSIGRILKEDSHISTGLKGKKGIGWNMLDHTKEVTYVETETAGNTNNASFDTVPYHKSFFYIMKI